MSLSMLRFPKPNPFRSAVYLKWIRSWPCLVCGKAPVEAAHVVGQRGTATKTDDTYTVPLCAGHHRLKPDSHHQLGEGPFEDRHSLDLKREVIRFQTEFIRTRLEAE